MSKVIKAEAVSNVTTKCISGEVQIKNNQIEALNRRIEVLEKQLLEANWQNVELSKSKTANEETVTRLKATLWDMAERIAILERRLKNVQEAAARTKKV